MFVTGNTMHKMSFDYQGLGKPHGGK